MENDKKLLLIVDPQVDFISGTLPVSGAAEAMDKLADYVCAHGSEYAVCVATVDWHPACHSSFAAHGGQWPEHCVQHSVGAAIYPKLLASLNVSMENMYILSKGDSADCEEYSIFKNKKSAAQLDAIVCDCGIEQIDVCGLAGDVCVLNTLNDAVVRYNNIRFNVLKEFSPSLDGGEKLSQAIKDLKL